MRTNKTLRIASVLLIAVLMTTCVIGGTFAKYTSTTNATVSASTAKWDVTINGSAAETPIAFHLADTIKDSDGTSAEEHVKTGVIAPGTTGSFSFAIKNASDVDATASVTFTLTNTKNVPIKFYSDAAMSAEKEIEAVDGTYTAGSIASLAKNSAEATNVVVYWKWDFNAAGNDNAFADAALQINAVIAVDQID